MRPRPGVTPVVHTSTGVGPVMAGLLVSIVICLISILLLSLIIHFTPVPETILPIAALATALFSMFLGGIKAGRRSQSYGWLHGGASGVCFVIVMYLLGIVAGGGLGSLITLMIRAGTGFGVGVVGGVFGINL